MALARRSVYKKNRESSLFQLITLIIFKLINPHQDYYIICCNKYLVYTSPLTFTGHFASFAEQVKWSSLHKSQKCTGQPIIKAIIRAYSVQQQISWLQYSRSHSISGSSSLLPPTLVPIIPLITHLAYLKIWKAVIILYRHYRYCLSWNLMLHQITILRNNWSSQLCNSMNS